MSLETVRKYVALAAELGAGSVVLIGGEPTMHPEFFKIIEIIRSAGLRVFLATNGIKFSNPEFLEKTVNAGVSSVVVSFKAANREMFLEETGIQMFDKQVRAIKNLVGSGINNIVSITACENQIKNFDEMIRAVKSMGANKVFLDTGMPVFSDGKSVVDDIRTPKEMAQFILEAYPKLERSGLNFNFKLGLPFCLFPKEFIEKIINDGNTSTRCQMMDKGSLIISPDGNILPCNHLCDLSLGKIGEEFTNAEEFHDYRKSEKVAKFYRKVNSCSNNKCVSCQYWRMCGSGCKIYWFHYGADSLLGDFNNPK